MVFRDTKPCSRAGGNSLGLATLGCMGNTGHNLRQEP